MAIIHNKDKRTGVTYVYESYSYWDKDKKQSRSKRRLIGRLDEETGEVIPTDGRCKKRSPFYEGDTDTDKTPRTLNEYKEAYRKLKEENEKLRKEIEKLTAVNQE